MDPSEFHYKTLKNSKYFQISNPKLIKENSIFFFYTKKHFT
jgi:hypothetical protein